jgi:SH3-like domain-containing protein
MHRDALRRLILLGLIGSFAPANAGAAALASPPASPPEPPHFASLSSNKVYMREGPTYAHRVLWMYRRKGLPVEVLASFDVWRRVVDPHGTIGWLHSSMVSDHRTVEVVSAAPAPIRRRVDEDSAILALAQTGAIAKLEACEEEVCEVSAGGIDGWIDKKNIWGVRAGEIFH